LTIVPAPAPLPQCFFWEYLRSLLRLALDADDRRGQNGDQNSIGGGMNILLAADGSGYTKRMLAYVAAHDEWLGTLHR
jgi:hypothetical protein